MAFLILLLFIAVPIAEIAIFIEAGELIGLAPTLALVVLTAILGTAMLRHQGLRALRRAEAALQRNELPMDEVLTGICLLVAGALLLTPGFLTDTVGFALMVPHVRRFLGQAIFHLLLRRGRAGVWAGGGMSGSMGSNMGDDAPDRGPNGGTVIDGEFYEVKDSPPADRGQIETEPR